MTRPLPHPDAAEGRGTGAQLGRRPPKLLALTRHDQATLAVFADLHRINMLEAAIIADHAALNGDDRPNTPTH